MTLGMKRGRILAISIGLCAASLASGPRAGGQPAVRAKPKPAASPAPAASSAPAPVFFPSASPYAVPTPARPPQAETALKASDLKDVLEERGIDVHARLEEDLYSFSAAMLVHAGLSRTRQVLTDYQIYARIIPFVDKTEWNLLSRTLLVEGGIWGFRLKSWVKFEEPDAQDAGWIHYRIVGGHFAGLEGDITFAGKGEKGSLVFFRGALRGSHWPPKFVIERGAEIVFGFTAKRMRGFVESGEALSVSPVPGPLSPSPSASASAPIKEKNDVAPIPQPRSRF